MKDERIRAEIMSARKNNLPVYVVNDKKNADKMIELGYCAVVIAEEVQDYLLDLPGTKVIIITKNSDEGKKFAGDIRKQVENYAYATAIFIPSRKDNGDLSDYLDNCYDVRDLERHMSELKYQYAKYIKLEAGTGEETQVKGIVADHLADALARTLPYIIVKDLADGTEHIYLWNHGVYEKSTAVMVKKEIKRYIPSGLASDALLRNVYSLFLCNENAKVIDASMLNNNEDIINLRNGFLNIRTGKIEPHQSDELTTWQLDFDYKPSERECPVFDKFINDLCSTKDGIIDEDIKARIQEFGGLLLSNINVSRVKKCLMLVSPIGNTGKSQLLKLFSKMLGPGKTANIPLQNMTEKNRFGLSQTIDTRAIICGDQTGAVVQDSSVFKMLTGGDAVRIEIKQKTPFDFYFNGGIVIACNAAPTFKDDKGSHIFDRLLVIPCEHVVSEQEADSYICDKMLTEKTAIFNWFLDGLNRLIKNNFHFTKSERADIFMCEYREKQDTVYRFLQENEFVVTNNPHDTVKKSTFNKAYTSWLKQNQLDGVAEKNVKYRLQKLGVNCKKTSYETETGVWCYTFIKDTKNYLS